MPSVKPTRFTAFEFSEQEYKSAAVFNPLQKMHIMTKQCEIAESLLNIEARTEEDGKVAEVDRAFLKGQLSVLGWLLEISESMELNIREEESSHDFVVAKPSQDHNLFNPSQETEGE